MVSGQPQGLNSLLHLTSEPGLSPLEDCNRGLWTFGNFLEIFLHRLCAPVREIVGRELRDVLPLPLPSLSTFEQWLSIAPLPELLDQKLSPALDLGQRFDATVPWRFGCG